VKETTLDAHITTHVCSYIAAVNAINIWLASLIDQGLQQQKIIYLRWTPGPFLFVDLGQHQFFVRRFSAGRHCEANSSLRPCKKRRRRVTHSNAAVFPGWVVANMVTPFCIWFALVTSCNSECHEHRVSKIAPPAAHGEWFRFIETGPVLHQGRKSTPHVCIY